MPEAVQKATGDEMMNINARAVLSALGVTDAELDSGDLVVSSP